MDRENAYQGAGINPSDWRNLSLNDLTQINQSGHQRMQKMQEKKNLDPDEKKLYTFYALQMHWVDPLCPAIPDGRYVLSIRNSSDLNPFSFFI